MMFNKKTAAASLPYVIAVSLFSLLLLSGFIGWVYFSQHTKTVSLVKTTKEKVNRSFLIASIKSTPERKLTVNNPSIKYFRHGIFSVITNIEEETKSGAMIGYSPQYSNLALFLPDQGNTLYLGVNTPVRGEIHVSSSGIRPTSIGYGTEKGKQDYLLKKSSSNLPEIAPNLENQLDALLNPFLWNLPGQTTIPDKSVNSFFAPTLNIELNVPTTIGDVELIGNIWIRSTAPIIISSSSKLIDIVISAPIVVIEEGFSGQLQVIASKKIEVAPNCQLSYPSTLWIHETTNEEKVPHGQIIVAQHSAINGYVGMTSSKPAQTTKTNITIGAQTSINGLIYCSGTLSLAGKVSGSVFTKNIVFQHQGIRYVNHLVQGEIDGINRPFGALDFGFKKNGTPKVIQWLY